MLALKKGRSLCGSYSKILDMQVNGHPYLFRIDSVDQKETSLSHAL
jgi:hypothetical protein